MYKIYDVFQDFPVSQKFGVNKEFYKKLKIEGHNGVDYGIPVGTPLRSCINGRVVQIGHDNGGFGNFVMLFDYVQFMYVVYAHLSKLKIKKQWANVSKGKLIGWSGNSGWSTGPHLHFGIRPSTKTWGIKYKDNGFHGYINPYGPEVELIGV